MIIVIGSVNARPDALDEVLRLSLEHVDRSRREPGCVRHSVHRDVEDPNHLVFVEHWDGREALDEHFRLAPSRAFAKTVTQLATRPPSIEIYEAEPVTF